MRVIAGLLLVGCLAATAAGCGKSGRFSRQSTAAAPSQARPAAVPSPSPTPCVTAYRDDEAAARAKKKLAADLRKLVGRSAGRVEVMAKDLRTGAAVGYHENGNQQITASGAKVDILVTLLRQARAGHRKLSGWERATAELMIKHSDNRAADDLYVRIGGGGGMAATYRALRMRQTHPGPSHFWGGTTTSPYDRVRLMTALVKGSKALHPADRAYVLKLMEQVEHAQKWGISAAARKGDRVALKNGWTDRPFIHDTWAVTSYGRVWAKDRDYLISVQTDIQPGMERGLATIEAVSKLVAARMPGLDPVRYRSCASPVAP